MIEQSIYSKRLKSVRITKLNSLSGCCCICGREDASANLHLAKGILSPRPDVTHCLVHIDCFNEAYEQQESKI